MYQMATAQTDEDGSDSKMRENQPRGEDGSFGGYDDEPWLNAVERLESGSTGEVHDSVCENWDGEGPGYKTTYDKLHDLADEGEVERQNVGGNWLWTHKEGQS